MSFDEIAFLAAVEPRLTVLRILTATVVSQSRQDLVAATELSPARVDSILGDLAAREWVVKTDEGHRGTPAGTVVVEGFTTMVATLETERRLRDVVEWLPTDAVDFDVRWLRDAEIVLPVPGEPRVIFAPGHTPGSCALFVEDRDALLCGDVLATRNIYTGREGDPQLLGPSDEDHDEARASLARLEGLGTVTLLPGHGNPWRGEIDVALALAR